MACPTGFESSTRSILSYGNSSIECLPSCRSPVYTTEEWQLYGLIVYITRWTATTVLAFLTILWLATPASLRRINHPFILSFALFSGLAEISMLFLHSNRSILHSSYFDEQVFCATSTATSSASKPGDGLCAVSSLAFVYFYLSFSVSYCIHALDMFSRVVLGWKHPIWKYIYRVYMPCVVLLPCIPTVYLGAAQLYGYSRGEFFCLVSEQSNNADVFVFYTPLAVLSGVSLLATLGCFIKTVKFFASTGNKQAGAAAEERRSQQRENIMSSYLQGGGSMRRNTSKREKDRDKDRDGEKDRDKVKDKEAHVVVGVENIANNNNNDGDNDTNDHFPNTAAAGAVMIKPTVEGGSNCCCHLFSSSLMTTSSSSHCFHKMFCSGSCSMRSSHHKIAVAMRPPPPQLSQVRDRDRDSNQHCSSKEHNDSAAFSDLGAQPQQQQGGGAVAVAAEQNQQTDDQQQQQLQQQLHSNAGNNDNDNSNNWGNNNNDHNNDNGDNDSSEEAPSPLSEPAAAAHLQPGAASLAGGGGSMRHVLATLSKQSRMTMKIGSVLRTTFLFSFLCFFPTITIVVLRLYAYIHKEQYDLSFQSWASCVLDNYDFITNDSWVSVCGKYPSVRVPPINRAVITLLIATQAVISAVMAVRTTIASTGVRHLWEVKGYCLHTFSPKHLAGMFVNYEGRCMHILYMCCCCVCTVGGRGGGEKAGGVRKKPRSAYPSESTVYFRIPNFRRHSVSAGAGGGGGVGRRGSSSGGSSMGSGHIGGMDKLGGGGRMSFLFLPTIQRRSSLGILGSGDGVSNTGGGGIHLTMGGVPLTPDEKIRVRRTHESLLSRRIAGGGPDNRKSSGGTSGSGGGLRSMPASFRVAGGGGGGGGAGNVSASFRVAGGGGGTALNRVKEEVNWYEEMERKYQAERKQRVRDRMAAQHHHESLHPTAIISDPPPTMTIKTDTPTNNNVVPVATTAVTAGGDGGQSVAVSSSPSSSSSSDHAITGATVTTKP